MRISFQRANPTFGNFGDKAELVPLPGCLETMLDQFVLPNARRTRRPTLPISPLSLPCISPTSAPYLPRRDTSAQFRDTTMKDAAVLEVLEEYAERLQEWYKKTAADDTKEEVLSDKLTLTPTPTPTLTPTPTPTPTLTLT